MGPILQTALSYVHSKATVKDSYTIRMISHIHFRGGRNPWSQLEASAITESQINAEEMRNTDEGEITAEKTIDQEIDIVSNTSDAQV